MRMLRGVFIAFASMSVLVISFICFAADDDLLNYIPSIVKAQTTVNPVGTYTGPGVVTFGNCACRIESGTITVTDGPIADTYKIAYSGFNTTDCVSSSGQCSWNDSGTNVPAVMKNKELVFGQAGRGSYQSNGTTYYYQSNTNGSIDLSNSTPIFVKSSAWQVTGPPDNAYDAVVRLTLQKTP